MKTKKTDQTIPVHIVDIDSYIPVLQELIGQGKTVSLTVTGGSMTPFLIHGRDVVYLCKPEKPLCAGQIVFYIRPSGQYVLHRIHHIDKDGMLYLVGDAQAQLEGPLSPDCVFAGVCGVRRKGKEIRPGELLWEFFSRIWLHLLPLRRPLMEFYARICGNK